MKINFGTWVFCPKLITSSFATIFFILFLHLGSWQLDRAEQKRELQSFFNEQQTKEAINLNNSFKRNHGLNYNFINRGRTGLNELLWRKVTAAGNFLENQQILLDNQVNNGQAGYYVYTPFKVKGVDEIFLVNRGWVPVGVDRNKIPNLNFTKGRATIYGVLKKAPRTGILLADNQAEKLNENITRFQKIDTYELTRLIKLNKIKKFANNPFLYPIFPYVIRLSPESEHGYIRNWESRNSGENIHIGYAYQWFAFAATLFVIYLVLNIKRQDHKNE